MADLIRKFQGQVTGLAQGQVTGLATVFPGEAKATEILTRAFDQGLGGVKLHVHVQCFDMDSPQMDEICAVCQTHDKPMVVHAGREPASDHYPCNPHDLCRADKVAGILTRFPDLKFCVPHLGFDEISPYQSLMAAHDNLWLDTAMVLTDYFPAHTRPDLRSFPLDRVMYGSDFPNIPYAWDRELKWLADAGLSSKELAQVTWENAVRFFNLDFNGSAII